MIGWSALPNVVGAWAVKEGSLEPNGIPFRYVLKALSLVFCVLVSAQALSTMIKAFLRLTGRSSDPIYEVSDEL